jgi:peroxiredoxin
LLSRQLVPYCNLELRTLQANIGEFEARGTRLVAISPQIPDESLSVTEKNDLTFDVLSDVGTTSPRTVACLWTSQLNSPPYARAAATTSSARTVEMIVIPASYVVGQDGVASWAFVDSDHTKRAEPSDMIAALEALR